MTHTPDRIIRERERREITGVSKTTWWRWEAEGQVPRRRTLGPNSMGWRLSEILEWLENRPLAKQERTAA